MPLSIAERDRWKAWDGFLETNPDAGFMQTSWWAEFRASMGYESFGITLRENGAIVGGAMVMKWSYGTRGCFYYLPDGPVLPSDESLAGEVFEAILQDIEKHRRSEQKTVSHVRIEPCWQRLPGFVRGFQVCAPGDVYTEPRSTLYVDLRPPEDAILAQMKPKGRYNIRVAQKHGVSVVEDTTPRGLEDFLGIYAETAARQGIEAKPARYFQKLVGLLSSSRQVSIYFAEHRRTRLASALVVYFGRRATYFFGGSLVLDRGVMAPYLLQFEIMRDARARGCEWYDLWGIARDDRPDDPWRQITDFKRKFGGVAIHLVPTLDRVFEPAAYDQYCAAHSRGSEWIISAPSTIHAVNTAAT